MNDQQLGLSLVSEYDDQIAALQKQKIAAVAALKAETVAKIKHEIAVLGLTAADLGFVGEFGDTGAGTVNTRAASAVAATKSTGNKVAPKYRDPVSGNTWTGRGKAPKWIEGQDRAPFLIDAPTSPAVTATPATQPQDPVQEPSDTTGEFTKPNPKVIRAPAEEAA